MGVGYYRSSPFESHWTCKHFIKCSKEMCWLLIRNTFPVIFVTTYRYLPVSLIPLFPDLISRFSAIPIFSVYMRTRWLRRLMKTRISQMVSARINSQFSISVLQKNSCLFFINDLVFMFIPIIENFPNHRSQELLESTIRYQKSYYTEVPRLATFQH